MLWGCATTPFAVALRRVRGCFTLVFVLVVRGGAGAPRELVGKQDPYCLAEFKDQRQRTNTVRNGGTNPYFNEDELEL